MHSKDNGLSFKFSRTSFHTWQTRINLVLVKKSLWNIVNGKEENPQDPTQATAWEVRNDKAQAKGKDINDNGALAAPSTPT